MQVDSQSTTPNIDFNEVFQMYNSILLKHAKYKVSDVELSEDLVQETYLKAWKYLVNGGKIETMKTFLYQVLNNLIIDQYRKRKDSSLDFLLEEGGFEPHIDEREGLMTTLEGRDLFQKIEDLPEPYRELMKMRYVEDLTLDEMALITGKNKNTLSVNLHRGADKLRELYEAKVA